MSPAEAQEAITTHGGIRAASRALGMPYSTLHGRAKGKAAPKPKRPAVAAVLPSGDLPIDDLIAHRTRAFKAKLEKVDAQHWFKIELPERKPIGIMWMGDPHLDDDGCNWALLQEHIEICARPGVYAANIGDTTNNWAGRLARIYADQDTSEHTARRFAKWFLEHKDISWLVWLMGNHDAWGAGIDILKLMNRRNVPMLDWEAKFELHFPGDKGSEPVRVHAAHDFPGHSMWNIGHGPTRAAKMTSDADLLVCGHKHDWTVQQFELAGRGRCPVIARARGYKWTDTYATRLGFQSSRNGAAIFTIIRPDAPASSRVMAFADAEAGAAVLAALRGEPQPKAKHHGKASKSTNGSGGNGKPPKRSAAKRGRVRN